MDKKTKKQIELHTAGATVRHNNPFSGLESFKYKRPIDLDFVNKWVNPFYFNLNKQSNDWVNEMIRLKSELKEEIILRNLGDFNWRTRSTGSYFAAITQAYHLEDIIGVHLLKSEVCYAGDMYAKTLASFNTEKSVNYLNQYLNFYLKKPELYFDQDSVITALKYLDEINNTNYIENHIEDWIKFSNWRSNYTYRNLSNLKKTMPENTIEIENQLNEIIVTTPVIDTKAFNSYINTLQIIINN